MKLRLLRHGLLLFLLACVGAAQAGNVEIKGFTATTFNLDRARAFFTGPLQFTAVGETQDAKGKTAELRLGEETLWLFEPAQTGAAAPLAMAANDRRFQHIAIVVSDIQAATKRLQAAGAVLVSEDPQILPEQNFDAAGIAALYFRDPDGHFLELIQFPANKGEPKWHRRSAALFLGIDHSAMVVADVEASLRFYRDALGLTLTGRSLNTGAEQDALNGLRGSEVKIASLRGAKGPGIELLQYLRPGLVRSNESAMNDALHWQIAMQSTQFQSASASGVQRDFDGHALQLTPVADTVARAGTLAHEAWQQHWPRYLMEGAQLGIFMIVTLYFTIALEHSASPLRRWVPSDLHRRMLMGLVIGGTVIALIYSDWGRLSGAQFNPSVTLAFLSLSRIEPWDALFYVIAQCVGGWLGLWLAALPVRRAAADDKVRWVLTSPGKHRLRTAVAAEFAIAFLLMFSLLQVFHQPALKPWVGLIAGLHLWAFISFEAPLSGMSLNPARSAASAFLAADYRALWIYFTAPPLAMWLAAQICRRLINS